jgi:hypothetical protein
MPLSLSFDRAARLLARQVFGVVNDDTREAAEDALECALQEIEIETHLVAQEREGTLALTGANTYALSSVSVDILRVVKGWTQYGDLEVMRKAEFVTRYPDFSNWAAGLPKTIVLWGEDSLYVWPDQADITLNLMYYKLIDRNMSGSILSKLLDIGRKFADSAKETRGVNRIIAREALETLNKAQARAEDAPVRLLPEERVGIINHFKRGRR